jgi:hypothetical protein
MANNPFNQKPQRQVNPRFSLGGSQNGTETEDFTPKASPVRASRPAPRPIGEQADSSPAPAFSDPSVSKVNPNSMFGGDEDSLNLDVGVEDVPRAITPASQSPITPSVHEQAPQAAPVRIQPNQKVASPVVGFDEDDIDLDVGVDDAETPYTPPVATTPVVPVAAPRPVSAPVNLAAEDDLNLDVGVNETDTAPVVPSDETVVSTDNSVFVEEPTAPVSAALDSPVADEEDLNLDVGVDETVAPEVEYVAPASVKDQVVAPSPVVEEASVPVQRAPAIRSINPLFADPSPAPVAKSAPVPVQKTPVSRGVNPLFADPSTTLDEEDINLDVGIDDGPSVAKRQVNSRFDFKADKQNNTREDPDRLPKWKKTGALIDAEDGDEFKKQKNKRANKRSQNTGNRGFQLQERDIVLLRFLNKYQFSYPDALARVLNSTPQSINNRLRTLEKFDLVKRQTISAGATLWQTRKAGIELTGMSFTENKKAISLGTIRHTIGLVNLAAELEREDEESKDILGLSDKFGEPFPVKNRFPGGIRLYGEDALDSELTWGEMTVTEREIRQGQKRYRGGRSSAEMRDMVDLAILNPEAPELEEGNEGLFVVYGTGGKTGEHVPDLVVSRPRNPDGTPNHFAVELELTPKNPSDWKRILRSYREAGGMYSRVYYFTPDKPIANMIRNADEEVGLGDKLIIRKYTPKNKRQPFLG